MTKNKYKNIKITKMFRGFADARDYIVAQCEQRKEGIEFEYKGEKRYVHPNDISSGEITARNIEAKFPLPNGKKTFCLISWSWKKLPTEKDIEVEKINQLEFF